ncbi:MAG: WXG100 family type VII secretion target [Coriobacteriales bacterium]|jgi:WXG100 family type VII secretion target|nr:WXG100 family type VII secretion target [Coriobacteriales bacterium]
MAGRIRITPDDLRRTNKKLATYSTDIGNIARRVNKDLDTLVSSWDGAARDTFLSTYNREYRKLLTTQIPELLAGLGKQLAGVADSLEQTDADLASQLKG